MLAGVSVTGALAGVSVTGPPPMQGSATEDSGAGTRGCGEVIKVIY